MVGLECVTVDSRVSAVALMNRCIASATNGTDQAFLVDRPEEYQATTDFIKILLHKSSGGNFVASGRLVLVIPRSY